MKLTKQHHHTSSGRIVLKLKQKEESSDKIKTWHETANRKELQMVQVSSIKLIYAYIINSQFWILFPLTQTSCRLRNFSIISVLALTISNVFLTLRLLQVSDCTGGANSGSGAHFNNINRNDRSAVAALESRNALLTPASCLEYVLADPSLNSTDKPVFSGLDLKLGRWDARRMYKVFDHAVVGAKFVELSEKFNVTLATQSSVEKIFSLVQGEQSDVPILCIFSTVIIVSFFNVLVLLTVSHHWSGPISVVVFAAGDDELFILQLYLTYLRRCFATIHERVSFHLAMPKDRAATNVRGVHLSDLSMFNCAKPEETLDELLKRRTAETKKWRIKASHAIDGASFFLFLVTNK